MRETTPTARSDDDALKAIKFMAMKALIFMVVPALLAAIAAAVILW